MGILNATSEVAAAVAIGVTPTITPATAVRMASIPAAETAEVIENAARPAVQPERPAITTILTVDIKLAGLRTGANSWSARVEVPESFTLSELHFAIQRMVSFDDDHLHEFFAGRNWRDRKTTFSESASPLDLNEGEEVPLSEVFPLPKGQKLYYNFDFGDDWLFEITCHPEVKQADRKTKRAKLVHEKGRRPIQYPSEDDEG